MSGWPASTWVAMIVFWSFVAGCVVHWARRGLRATPAARRTLFGLRPPETSRFEFFGELDVAISTSSRALYGAGVAIAGAALGGIAVGTLRAPAVALSITSANRLAVCLQADGRSQVFYFPSGSGVLRWLGGGERCVNGVRALRYALRLPSFPTELSVLLPEVGQPYLRP